MATRFDDWEGQFLEHFGTRGMKWGVRRFQNEDGSLTEAGKQHYGVGGDRSARGVSRDLRRLEKERAGSQARADYYQKRTAKARRKAELKAKETGKDVKVSKRVEKMESKAKEYRKLEKASEKLTKKIISDSLKKGYFIKSRDTMRFVRKGKDKALFILGRKGTSVNSVKYHVKNDGLGVRTHRKTIGMINRRRHASNFAGLHIKVG